VGAEAGCAVGFEVGEELVVRLLDECLGYGWGELRTCLKRSKLSRIVPPPLADRSMMSFLFPVALDLARNCWATS
jgi:hypothetical protein